MFFSPKNAFGIDISDYSVEILELERVATADFRVSSYSRGVLEKGIVEDGLIQDRGRLASRIQETMERAVPRLPKTTRVIASLPESRTYIHVFPVPAGLRDDELRELIRREASRIVPFDITDIVFDMARGPRRGRLEEILFAAAERKVSESYGALFGGLDLELAALDLESASAARTISRIHTSGKPFCIVDIGSRTTNLVLVDAKGFLRHSFSIPVAGAHMTYAIARALQIPEESAEHLKKQIGLNPDYQDGRMVLILQKVVGEIIKELERILEFHKNTYGEEVRDMYLVGGGSLLPHISTYIASNTGRAVEVFHPREVPQEWGQDLTGREHPVFFTNVIGLALRGLLHDPGKAGINLVLRQEEESGGWFLKLIRRSINPKIGESDDPMIR